jgi:integrase
VNKGDRLAGERMTAQAVFKTVEAYAAAVGMKNFAPHELRPSYAKLAHNGRDRSVNDACFNEAVVLRSRKDPGPACYSDF